FKDAICQRCDWKGHLARVCRARQPATYCTRQPAAQMGPRKTQPRRPSAMHSSNMNRDPGNLQQSLWQPFTTLCNNVSSLIWKTVSESGSFVACLFTMEKLTFQDTLKEVMADEAAGGAMKTLQPPKHMPAPQ
ncbi:hypothetical protein E2320_007024, partial [Naja naja]